MQLQLHELAKVSNHSLKTEDVLKSLNEKLSAKEKRDFQDWLRIVKNQQQNSPKRYDRFF